MNKEILESKLVYWTLPETTPVHTKPNTKIIIEPDGDEVVHLYTSYQLWKVYLQSPDGEKYWTQRKLYYEKAQKRAEDLKETIEEEYQMNGIINNNYKSQN